MDDNVVEAIDDIEPVVKEEKDLLFADDLRQRRRGARDVTMMKMRRRLRHRRRRSGVGLAVGKTWVVLMATAALHRVAQSPPRARFVSRTRNSAACSR